MAREGAEVALQALRVSDIGPHRPEVADARPRAGRHVRAGGGQQHDQADGLQHHRLPAHVRPGHQQSGLRRSEIDLQRDHALGTAALLQQQRMARAAEREIGRRLALRGPAVPLEAGARQRLQEVQLRVRLLARRQRVGLGPQALRQRPHDAIDLGLLLELRLVAAVVELDHREGLDEVRPAAARLIVQQARHLAMEFRLHREHVAVVAQGHELLGEPGGEALEQLFDPALDVRIEAPDFAADRAQLRRGVVADLAVRAEGLPEQRDQRVEIRQRSPDLREARKRFGVEPEQLPARAFPGGHGAPGFAQLRKIQAQGAGLEPLEPRPGVDGRLGQRSCALGESRLDFGDQGSAPGGFGYGEWSQGEDALASVLGAGAAREDRE